MDFIKDLFTSEQSLFTITFLAAVFMFIIKVTDLNIAKRLRSTGEGLFIKTLQRDKERERQQKQLARMGFKKQGWAKKYDEQIRNIIIGLRLGGVSVENFTTGFVFVGVALFIVYTVLFESIFIGLILVVPSIIFIIALLVTITKNSVRLNDERVMDSLDIICPTIEHDVISAIKKSLDAIDPKIRIYYVDFLNNIELRGMLFSEAIMILNSKLGPRFSEFADKAVIFQDTGDEGSNEMFIDIVEINRYIREINNRAELKFQEINFNMTGSSLLIMAFMAYTYVTPLTSEIMVKSMIGKLISSICITSLILMFAVSRLNQANIDYDKINN